VKKNQAGIISGKIIAVCDVPMKASEHTTYLYQASYHGGGRRRKEEEKEEAWRRQTGRQKRRRDPGALWSSVSRGQITPAHFAPALPCPGGAPAEAFASPYRRLRGLLCAAVPW